MRRTCMKVLLPGNKDSDVLRLVVAMASLDDFIRQYLSISNGLEAGMFYSGRKATS